MKKLILMSVLLLAPIPVYAIDIDDIEQINKDLKTKIGITTQIQIEQVEPIGEYNFLKGVFHPWTKNDTYWQIGVVISQCIDWKQTKEIVIGYYETNPILGPEPTQGKIDEYFKMCIIGNYLIAKVLPNTWRRKWQMSSCLFQLYYINNNYQAGFKIGI